MFNRNAVAAALLGLASLTASAATGIFETGTPDANVAGDTDTFAATTLQIGNIVESTFSLGTTTNGAGWAVDSVTVVTDGTLTSPFQAYFQNTANSADDAYSLTGVLTGLNTYTFSFAALGNASSSLDGGSSYLFSLHDFNGKVVGDVNFSVTAVPEPETYAMMIAGLGALGFMARRRKAQ